MSPKWRKCVQNLQILIFRIHVFPEWVFVCFYCFYPSNSMSRYFLHPNLLSNHTTLFPKIFQMEVFSCREFEVGWGVFWDFWGIKAKKSGFWGISSKLAMLIHKFKSWNLGNKLKIFACGGLFCLEKLHYKAKTPEIFAPRRVLSFQNP